jgi:hypothetical protein
MNVNVEDCDRCSVLGVLVMLGKDADACSILASSVSDED